MRIASTAVRWLAGTLLTALAQTTLAQEVFVTPIRVSTISGSEMALRVVNNTGRGLMVSVDYTYRCPDGSESSSSRITHVSPRDSAQLTQGCVPTPDGKANGMQSVSGINFRWDLSPTERAIDAANAESQRRHQQEEQGRQRQAVLEKQRQEETDRNRRSQCGVDAQGNFDLDRFSAGIAGICFDWFPQLKIAQQRYREQEREKREVSQQRLEDAARARGREAEGRQVAAMRAKLDARHRAEALERQNQQDEARRRAEADQATRESMAREQREMAERGARYRDDPCGAVADLRARPPQAQAYPPNAVEPVKTGIDRYNAQLVAQWRQALEERVRLCSTHVNSSPARTPAPDPRAVAAAAAESERRQQALANAQAELSRVQAQGKETVAREAEKTKAVRDQNSDLANFIKSMK